MASTAIENKERRHLERLILLPVLLSLVIIWGGLFAFATVERKSTLDRVQNQLGSTVATLADFNELADRSAASTPAQTNAKRTAAFWHALLQYPSADFWVESRGRIVAGRPYAGNAAAIVAQDTRGAFTVHAAIPEAEALTEWQRGAWLGAAALAAVTVGFLILSRFLAGALRQRATAERAAAALADRATQLTLYRKQLEETVALRTEELADANTIVQNSPTILCRIRGEAPYPLMYISNNIAKFGHDPVALLSSPDWLGALVDSRDRAPVDAAMADMLERGADGDSVEFRLKNGGVDERWFEARYAPRRAPDGRLLEVEAIIIDIDERKAAEAKIELLARSDSLTGLANRATFLERLRQAFASTARGAQPFAIMYLDIDHFKSVNDTFGHATGDELLREVAARVTSCTRDTDLVARLGGDEFAVLQAEILEPADAGALAARIQRTLTVPYLLNGNEVRSSASIGICPHSSSSSDPDAMLAQADLALYRSKEEGRNQYRFYSADLDLQVLGRIEFAEELKRALDDGKLELFCVPQTELLTGDVVSMKAWVRWVHPTRGLLTQGDIVPILEKTPSGMELAHWLLDNACREMHRRRRDGAAPPVVAVDIRFTQLKNGDAFVRDVRETLAKWDLAPPDLELDVTEETLAQATLAQDETLRRLHESGVKIAITNFGTACSSFGYIRSYSVSRIALSRSFVAAGSSRRDLAAMINAIVGFARELGILIVVEQSQTQEQSAWLVPARSAAGENDAGSSDSRPIDMVG